MHKGPVLFIDKTCPSLDPTTRRKYHLQGVPQVSPTREKIIALGFQGSGVFRNKYISDVYDLNSVIEGVESIDEIVRIISDSSGSFTMQLVDPMSGHVYFLNDPLGGGFILEYEIGGRYALGVDPLSIKLALNQRGIQIQRSLSFQISGLATGTHAFAGDTPYQELRALPPGCGISVAPSGKKTVIDYQTNDYINLPNPRDYDELVYRGAAKILRNIEAVSNISAGYFLTDLTGGFDSRLVLAGILGTQRQNQYIASSIFDNSEWGYAEGLARSVGMKITKNRGLRAAITHPSSYFESCFAASRPSGGMISNDLNANAGAESFVNLQGGYGETFRTFSGYFLSNDSPVNYHDFFKEIWKWAPLHRKYVGQTKLYTEEAHQILTQKTMRIFNRGVDFKHENDSLSNFLYLQLRNRYWIGQQSYWSSRSQIRFDPLYNIHSIAAGYKLDFWRRKSNFVGLDTMRLLDAELLSFPWFGQDRVNERYRNEGYNPAPRPFAENPSILQEIPVTPRFSVQVQGDEDAPNSNDRELAEKFGLPALTLYGIRTWSSAAKEFLLDDTEAKMFFVPSAVQELFSKDELNRENALLIHDLISALFRAGSISPENISSDDRFIVR